MRIHQPGRDVGGGLRDCEENASNRRKRTCMIPAAGRRFFVCGLPLGLLLLPSVLSFAVKPLFVSRQCPRGEAKKYMLSLSQSPSLSERCVPKWHGTNDCDSINGQLLGYHHSCLKGPTTGCFSLSHYYHQSANTQIQKFEFHVPCSVCMLGNETA